MRLKSRMLSLSLALGAACYLALLWKGQHELSSHDNNTERQAQSLEEQKAIYFLNKQSGLRNVNRFGTIDMELRFRREPGDNRPPYRSLFDAAGNMTNRVRSLLHFGVIGFGKCGTTSMTTWLDAHPQLQSYPREVYDLMLEKPQEFVKKIYSMPVGDYKRGYKSPVDVSLYHTMNYFRDYWPDTKLIVGIRHPVHWFESLYNFRIQNLSSKKNHTTFPRPNDLIGRCFRTSHNTCTYKGEFALFLRNLGKTLANHNPRDALTGRYNVTTLESRMYAASRMRPPYPDIQQPVPNPVFLFEMRQLFKMTTTTITQPAAPIDSARTCKTFWNWTTRWRPCRSINGLDEIGTMITCSRSRMD